MKTRFFPKRNLVRKCWEFADETKTIFMVNKFLIHLAQKVNKEIDIKVYIYITAENNSKKYTQIRKYFQI